MDFPSDLSELVVFAAVAQTTSFTRAGELLGKDASSVSRAVTRLETRLSAVLVLRSTHGLQLTESGYAVYEHCQRMLDAAKAAEAAADALQSEPMGLLRVNAPLTFGLKHLSPHLPLFMTRYPKIRLDISFSDRYVELEARNFDLAVRICRRDDTSVLKSRRLAVDRRVLCASPDYFRRHGKPEKPEDLAGHECLLYTHDLAQTAKEEWWFQRDGKPFTVTVSGKFRTDTGEPLRHAAIQGFGIVQMPCFLAGEDLKKGALERILPEYDFEYRDICAVFPDNKRPSRKLTVFLDFLSEQIGKGKPYWEP